MSLSEALAAAALLVSVIAVVFSGLTWSTGRRSANASERSAGASERSASAAETSAHTANASADAAQRSAAAAEGQLDLSRTTRAEGVRARELAQRTPRFRMGQIDWRGGLLAASADLLLISSSPAIERVDITITGAPGLGKTGSGIRDAPGVTWERPAAGEPYSVTFERTGSAPAILHLRCQLTDADDSEIIELDLEAQRDAESTPAR